MEINQIEAVIEGLLFAAGDPLPLEKIAEIIEVDKKTTRLIIENLKKKFQTSGRGLIIREIDNAYQFCTKPEHHEYIKRLVEPRQRQALSQAAFETLAIIAYKQPITKAKIEQVRGVNSDSAVTRLLERNLIKESGRLDCPGKPILYSTTDEFLRSFGFSSVSDLPVLQMDEVKVLEENQPVE